ncbi:uncharacterized protein Bfra_007581 [Botrytis fragariae]|uniref:Uncharacterized protein n=1 Tax=Botrytis fragariae TaxID=1964551 RepID=A0A8H6EG97_9HELO|nr:uncharacterized protein Bfra_007581 [Botrytis fragariae]KAF5871068.1 hypothetical protein Bfra_007581 [Botrytis fragariae]
MKANEPQLWGLLIVLTREKTFQNGGRKENMNAYSKKRDWYLGDFLDSSLSLLHHAVCAPCRSFWISVVTKHYLMIRMAGKKVLGTRSLAYEAQYEKYRAVLYLEGTKLMYIPYAPIILVVYRCTLGNDLVRFPKWIN